MLFPIACNCTAVEIGLQSMILGSGVSPAKAVVADVANAIALMVQGPFVVIPPSRFVQVNFLTVWYPSTVKLVSGKEPTTFLVAGSISTCLPVNGSLATTVRTLLLAFFV